MIDPKMVELVRFNGLPHIFGKVETELDRIQGVLRWVIAEMDHRYKLFSELNCRDLEAYNRKMEKRGESSFPRIVVIIDELADLMMSAPTQPNLRLSGWLNWHVLLEFISSWQPNVPVRMWSPD